MPVAAPNQTRLKILSSVLYLESFTVAELCLHAGLDRSMVYRELSELQQQGILKSNSVVVEGETAPAHRPPKRYELSSDPKLREQLEEELGSFLPDFEDPASNRHLKKAQEILNVLVGDLLQIAIEPLTNQELDRWEKTVQERFSEADKELKRATWESETDFSEEGVSDHPIMIATRLYDGLNAQFQAQLRGERTRRSSEAVRFTWADILTSALRVAVPATGVLSFATSGKLLEDAVYLTKVSAQVSKKIKEQMERRKDLPKANWELFLPYLSSLQLDLRDVQSNSELLATLAKHGIEYGNSVTEPLAIVRQLASETDDYRLFFNEANLAQIAQQTSEAYDSWIHYLAKLWSGPAIEKLVQPLVARVAAERWSAEAYREAVREITMQCEASVSALSETPFEQNQGYAIELQLYNPRQDKSGKESALIPIAEPLVQNKRLYVATSAANPAPVLGLPSFVCAAWFHGPLDKRKAWELAAKVDPSERIVKVEFFRGASSASRARAERILKSSLSAELVG